MVLLTTSAVAADEPVYPWLAGKRPSASIVQRIAPPAGATRVPVEAGTFAVWLRGLPLREGRGTVFLHNGRKKPNQQVHHAVLKIDVGEKDLQQCADAVIRLRAEYLFSRKRFDRIHFNFTSGHRADFNRWAEGYRPVVRGRQVRWVKSAAADASYRSFRRYLDVVFTYAGTASLSRELVRVKDPRQMRIGDVFIRGGYPGHAAIVVDLAADARTGRKYFLLVQSFMPAQDMHVLRNPGDARRSPWYDAAFGDELRTPEWTFRRSELMRFKEDGNDR